MRTIKYKSLRGLLMQSGSRYLTFNDFNRGRFYHKTKGWVNFKLSESGRTSAARLFAGVLWNRVDDGRISQCLNYYGRNCGILDRLWIDKNGRATYCAGQDYPSEIRTIQRLLA